jgi:hypothetical protein
MNQIEWTNYFTSRIFKEEMAFDEVRKYLENEGLDEEQIKLIVRQVDKEVHQNLMIRSKRLVLDRIINYGYLLTLIGLTTTIGTIVGFIRSPTNYILIIAYGPLTIGPILIFAGVRRKKRKNDMSFKRPSENLLRSRRKI